MTYQKKHIIFRSEFEEKFRENQFKREKQLVIERTFESPLRVCECGYQLAKYSFYNTKAKGDKKRLQLMIGSVVYDAL